MGQGCVKSPVDCVCPLLIHSLRQRSFVANGYRVEYEWIMAVTRIVANLFSNDPIALAKFYADVFGLEIPLDMGWISFLTNDSYQKIELHAASQGGSGTELPVISIGVDDLDATEAAVRQSGAEVVYGPVTEDWGLRRFYFRDPAGNLINVVDS